MQQGQEAHGDENQGLLNRGRVIEEVVTPREFAKTYDCFKALVRCMNPKPGGGYYTYFVTIPKQLVQHLDLKKGDLVEVAIRPLLERKGVQSGQNEQSGNGAHEQGEMKDEESDEVRRKGEHLR